VYAIVRSGGRQERVAVGDVFELDRVSSGPGESFQLPVLLLVDGDAITSDIEALGSVTVTAEVVDHTKGPKIVIQKYKNKTGYKKRQGHRQRLTKVKITGIDNGQGASAPAVTLSKTDAEAMVTAPIDSSTVDSSTVESSSVESSHTETGE